MKRRTILALLFVALAASACSGGAGAPPSTPLPVATVAPAVPPTLAASPTPAATATATVPPTSANPLDALSSIFRGWAGVKSFRNKITTTTSAGATTELTLDVVMPDRFHIVSKQFEAIVIGATDYLKIGTTWRKIALPKGLDFSFADLKARAAELGTSTDIKLIGPDMLDGTPTLVYQYTVTIKTPTPFTRTSKVWVAVSDQLPRQVESVSLTGAKTTAIYYDYNAAITIDPPIK